jgi:hypothetical protein
MLVKEHPEVQPMVAEYVQMTLLEKLRWRARQKEKDRRDAWAAREYAKDEGREESRQVIAEKDRIITEIQQELAELKKQLQDRG